MVIIFFLMLLGLGCYFVYKLIAPELNWRLNLSTIRLPWRRSRLREDVVSMVKPSELVVDETFPDHLKPQPDYEITESDKLARLERLLSEKNVDIERLAQALEAERHHRIQFEKTQQLLQEEILRLKQEIKLVRRGA